MGLTERLRQVPVYPVTKRLKRRYYASEHWRKRRGQRLLFDGLECAQCHSEEHLVVHHWAYPLFAEELADMLTLCTSCHAKVHRRRGVKIGWPKVVSKDIRDKVYKHEETDEHTQNGI